MGSGVRVPVSGFAVVDGGSFTATHVPFHWLPCPPDDRVPMPEVWLGSCVIRFRIGAGRVSKRVRAKAWPSDIGFSWSHSDPLPEADVARLFDAMEARMRYLIERHGIPAPEVISWQTQHAPVPEGATW